MANKLEELKDELDFLKKIEGDLPEKRSKVEEVLDNEQKRILDEKNELWKERVNIYNYIRTLKKYDVDDKEIRLNNAQNKVKYISNSIEECSKRIKDINIIKDAIKNNTIEGLIEKIKENITFEEALEKQQVGITPKRKLSLPGFRHGLLGNRGIRRMSLTLKKEPEKQQVDITPKRKLSLPGFRHRLSDNSARKIPVVIEKVPEKQQVDITPKRKL